MTLLVSLVLWNVVEVVTANDEGSVHLGGDDDTAEDTATDRHETGEWALLVCKNAKTRSAPIFQMNSKIAPFSSGSR